MSDQLVNRLQSHSKQLSGMTLDLSELDTEEVHRWITVADDLIIEAAAALSAQAVQPVDDDETEINAYEFMAQEFDRLAILRKMWSAQEVAATIRRYAIPKPATPPASAGPVAVRATHRHKKRGKEYVLIGFGKMQAEYWTDTVPTWEAEPSTSVDMREVAIYRSVYDGSLWARPREEFEDGRFEALTQQAPEKL